MSHRIPRFDHREQYRALRGEILDAIDGVLSSESLILGPKLRAFEEQMSRYLAAAGHGVGVGSGTDALAIALRALGIGPGDEVITVSLTAIGTVAAIRMVGARPVFCDIDPRTLVMDIRDAQRRITPRTRAIIPVHLYGNAVDMPAIQRLAGGYGLRIVEDCAQSCGTTIHGRLTGTLGDIGCFSFYPTKNLAAYGDGGFCFTPHRELAEAIRSIRNYGTDADAAANRSGVNSRLDELQAAVLEVKLRHLPAFLQKRRAIAGWYRALLSRKAVLPATTDEVDHSHHLFVVQLENREHAISRLHDAGIECGIHYRTPVHLMEAYHAPGCEPGSLPHTERAAGRVLSLPCYPELPMEAVEHICAVINDACEAA